MKRLDTKNARPLEPFEVISRGLSFCKETYLKMLPFTFLYAIIGFLPLLIQTFFVQSVDASHATIATANQSERVIFDTSKVTLLLFFEIIGYIIFASVLLVLYAALIHRLNDLIQNNKDNFTASLSLGFSKLLSLWGTTIVVGILIVIGFLVFVLPGIYLSIALFLSFYVLVLRNLGVIDSISQSYKLVYGNWWRTFFIFFLVFLAVVLIYFVVLSPVIMIIPSALPWLTEVQIGLLFFAVQMVLQALIYPVFLSVFLSVFYDLETRFAIKQAAEANAVPVRRD